MRRMLAALLVAACSPAAPPSDNAPAELNAEPINGLWYFNSRGATVSTGFGAPGSEYLFRVVCHGGTNQVKLTYSDELAPDQDTTLMLILPAQTFAIPARSSNEGQPTINAELDGADVRLAALAQQRDRFAVEAAGQTSVLPWDQSIARTLAACAS